MTDYLAPTYRATVDEEGVLTVRRDKPAVVLKRTWLPDGSIDFHYLSQDNAPTKSERRLLEAIDRTPVLYAARAGKRYWHVDEDCGAQRWHGQVTDGQMKKALLNLGFSEDCLIELWRECMSLPPHKHCPRVR